MDKTKPCDQCGLDELEENLWALKMETIATRFSPLSDKFGGTSLNQYHALMNT